MCKDELQLRLTLAVFAAWERAEQISNYPNKKYRSRWAKQFIKWYSKNRYYINVVLKRKRR
jgi:hypothetical protein